MARQQQTGYGSAACVSSTGVLCTAWVMEPNCAPGGEGVKMSEGQ